MSFRSQPTLSDYQLEIDKVKADTKIVNVDQPSPYLADQPDYTEHAKHFDPNYRDAAVYRLLLALEQNNLPELARAAPFVDLRQPLTNHPRQFTPLHRAIDEGNLEAVKVLVQSQGALADFLEQKESSGMTPLALAYVKGDMKIVEYLLSQGASFKNVVDPAGLSLLHVAAQNNDITMLERLLKFPFPATLLTSKNGSGKTPFELALENKHVAAMDCLLCTGVRIDQQLPNFPLCNIDLFHVAAQSGNLALIKSLIETNHACAVYLLELKNKNQETPLIVAAAFGQLEVLRYLLGKKVSLDAASRSFNNPSHAGNGNTALHWAVNYNHIEIVKLLVKAGASAPQVLSSQTNPLLYQAIQKDMQNNNGEMIEALLKNNPHARALCEQKNPEGKTALYLALEAKNHQAVTKLLAAYGPDLSLPIVMQGPQKSRNKQRSWVVEAACDGNVEMLTALIEGLRPFISQKDFFDLLNGKDLYQQTVLLLAAYRGHSEVVKYLLQQGADINAASQNPNDSNDPDNGKTPLHWAFAAKSVETVALLIQAGADASQLLPSGPKVSLLHQAIQSGNLKMVRAFLENNPQASVLLEQRDHRGHTPFMYAVMPPNTDEKIRIIRYLKEKGVDFGATIQGPPGAPHDDGKTALDLAFDRRNSLAVGALFECGGGYLIPAAPKANERAFLCEAVINLDVWMVKELIQGFERHRPQDLVAFLNQENTGSLTPLYLAVINRINSKHYVEISIVQYLCEKGGSTPECLTWALYQAAKANDEELVDLLLRSGAQLKKYCGPFLTGNAQHSHKTKIRYTLPINTEKMPDKIAAAVDLQEYIVKRDKQPDYLKKLSLFSKTAPLGVEKTTKVRAAKSLYGTQVLKKPPSETGYSPNDPAYQVGSRLGRLHKRLV